jgi:hypothetical protein
LEIPQSPKILWIILQQLFQVILQLFLTKILEFTIDTESKIGNKIIRKYFVIHPFEGTKEIMDLELHNISDEIPSLSYCSLALLVFSVMDGASFYRLLKVMEIFEKFHW